MGNYILYGISVMIIGFGLLLSVSVAVHDLYISHKAVDQENFQDCLEIYKGQCFYDEYNSVTKCNFEQFKKEEIVRIKQDR